MMFFFSASNVISCIGHIKDKTQEEQYGGASHSNCSLVNGEVRIMIFPL